MAQTESAPDFDEMFYSTKKLATEVPKYAAYNQKLLEHIRIPSYKAIAGCMQLLDTTDEPFRGLFIIEHDLSYRLVVKPRTIFTICVSRTLPKLEPSVPMPPVTPFINTFEYTH
jgi:hypothetical protein